MTDILDYLLFEPHRCNPDEGTPEEQLEGAAAGASGVAALKNAHPSEMEKEGYRPGTEILSTELFMHKKLLASSHKQQRFWRAL